MILFLLVCSNACSKPGITAAADAVIVPGVRCGPFILGKTTEREVSLMPVNKGIGFQFSRKGILDSVVVTTNDYRTDRNVRVGASEHDVVEVYGQGKDGNIDLIKGKTVIGRVGTAVLFYPGIQFVLAKQRVWAIVVVSK